MIFISYNQTVAGFPNLEATDPRVERIVHLDKIYSKSKDLKPNLFCIGNPGTQKSYILNDIFGA